MKRYFLSIVVGTSLLGLPMVTGCDRDKEVKTEEHTNADGSKSSDKVEVKTDSSGTTKETTSTETKTPDGSKTVDKSTKTVDPNGVTTESKTEHKSN